MTSSAKSTWLVPTLLIILTAVPVVAGAVRVAELTGGAEVTPENARFVAAPVPVLLHIVGATLFCVLGAFQFVPGLRRRKPGWHRIAGRVLVPAGLVAALSGLWMTLFYPQPPGDGELLTGFRLLFGSAMAVCIVLGFVAVRRRNFARHRGWMIRGYAIAQGAGTQALTHLPWMLVLGTPGETARALLVALGWVINLAVAEWIIRRRPTRASRSAGGVSRPARRRPARPSRSSPEPASCRTSPPTSSVPSR
ncbi:DUF2306 domain-containing protein [Plantactinospora soyae]|uniref:Membrane protein n=1 Tax=Plantactinospora soyae TaxID=1544732 RepID=A0A927M0T9_9ACTN|nr:DUF2306 domain-containing protein [Plantactinospora soyae]MBE1485509.1 putative membrane protein [Plantactinospora soyae]